jgi:hypothetical protein
MAPLLVLVLISGLSTHRSSVLKCYKIPSRLSRPRARRNVRTQMKTSVVRWNRFKIATPSRGASAEEISAICFSVTEACRQQYLLLREQARRRPIRHPDFHMVNFDVSISSPIPREARGLMSWARGLLES